MRHPKAVLAFALLALAAGAAALGCGAAGLGLGSLGLALAGFVAWALVAGGASSGCYASHPDDDADGAVEATVCLAPHADVPDSGPCLGAPIDDGGATDLGPCLRYDPDEGGTPDLVPCLSAPLEEAGDGAGELPICPPDLCDVCLNAPIDWCILDCPPPGADVAAASGPAPEAQRRLAAAGVLTAGQLARLRRLAGRG
ncbi:MAG: hypothetical protein HY907_14125 [Deltaproteobacteria bacterium]|nr:hypothetical protein [Deltaproteobacteria bacterium]